MITAQFVDIVFGFAFSLAVIYGALTDLTSYRIPNVVPYGLVALFAVYVAFAWNALPVLHHVGIGVFVFIMCVIFWQLKWLGGGDVKFLGAAALWMGPTKILPFLILLSLSAAVFVGILKFLLTWNPYFQGGSYPKFFKQLLNKTSERKVPYGLPIGLAALVAYFAF